MVQVPKAGAGCSATSRESQPSPNRLRSGLLHTSVMFASRDVLCGFLFCANMTMKPKFGDLQGEVTSFTLYHQNKYLDCR